MSASASPGGTDLRGLATLDDLRGFLWIPSCGGPLDRDRSSDW
jgi:hypothetical protein